MKPPDKKTLANGDIRQQYGLGRDLTTEVMQLLPHITLGRTGRGMKRLVKREDIETLLERAIEEGVDLWQLVRKHKGSPKNLWAWMTKVESVEGPWDHQKAEKVADKNLMEAES